MVFVNSQFNLIENILTLLDFNYIIVVISLSILILFSGKTSKILGEVQKVVGIGAGGTIIYKIWFDKSKNSSRSSSSNDNKKEDDNKKDEVKKKKVNLMKINKNNLNYAFILPWVISNINISESDSNMTQLSFGIFLLSFIGLICFINVLGCSITYYLIQKGNYETRYPQLSKFINYFKNSTLFFYVIEAFLCFTCLLLLSIFSFAFLYSNIGKN